jgi:hypothetical protein
MGWGGTQVVSPDYYDDPTDNFGWGIFWENYSQGSGGPPFIPQKYFARCNYSGVGGVSGAPADGPFGAQFQGVFGNRTKHSLGDISNADGTSQTLMFGEHCGQSTNVSFGGAIGTYPQTSYDWSIPSVGGLITFFGLANGVSSDVFQFSSNHSGIVQFASCDGSLRILKIGGTATIGSSDWQLLQDLAGWADGYPRSTADSSLITN